MEAHKIVSTDFKISPASGRKVRKQSKVIKDVNDKNGNGVPDDKEIRMETTQVDEARREDDEYHNGPDPVKHVYKYTVSKTGVNNGEKHERHVTTGLTTRKKHEIEHLARAHLVKQGYRIHENVMVESVDKGEQRFLMLARLGLVDKSDVSKLKIAVDALKADKQLTVQQRTLLLGVFTTLSDLVTGDDSIFNRVKMDVQKEATEQPPFDPPYKETPSDVKDKSGAVHTPSSRVKNLARLALKKQQKSK